jgi:hypothetical protein
VDTKTLNFLNTLRDNIFASSSQYDMVPPTAQQASGSHDDKKKKAAAVVVPSKDIDKSSVAYQRGKRSCTLADMKASGG